MIYKHLYVDVIIRVILITASCFALAFEYVLINDIIINLNLLGLIIIQVFLFIHSSNRINRDLRAFFVSVRNEDSTLLFSQRFRTKSFRRLHKSLQEVNDLIRKIKMENIEQNQYFKTITEHITVGLISFNQDGEVKLLNQAAKDLLNLKGTITMDLLDKRKKGFSKEILEMKPSEQKLVKVKIPGTKKTDLRQLSVRTARLKFQTESLKIISIQDIKSELDEKELDAWQNLIRVLTHEMMNSTGPIKSTTQTLIELLNAEQIPDFEKSNKDTSTFNDLLEGLKIIEERSIGLEKFVTHFRKFTILPKPDFQQVKLNELFQNLKILFDNELKKNNILLNIKTVPKDLCLEADKKLLEQLFINLVKNSTYYLRNTDNAVLEINARQQDDEKVEILVRDNGQGIQLSELEKIFIPFYTTKDDGSGIGLSLSKQIMRMHGGTINVHSEPGVQTVFTLKF